MTGRTGIGFRIATPRTDVGRMSRTVAGLGLLVALVCWAPPADAAGQSGRYTMTPTDDGALRLDTRTGAVSACGHDNGAWTCRAVADDHLDAQKETDRLATENRALVKENRALEVEIERLKKSAATAPRETDEKASGDRSWLPNERDVARVVAHLQEMMRRFRDMLESLWERMRETDT